MPPRKKGIGVPASSGENQQVGPSVDHISMHIEGTKSSGEASQPENKNIVTAIKDLQRFQAAMWAEFQSLRQGTFIPQATQGGQGPRESPYLTREDITTILFEAKKVESAIYIDTKPPYSEEVDS